VPLNPEIRNIKGGKIMRRKFQILIMCCLAVALITIGNACTKKETKVEIPVIDTSAADAAKKRAAEEAAARKKLSEEEAAAKRRAEEEAAAARKRAEAEATQKLLQDQLNAVESEKIYFDYDKADLKPEAQSILEKKAKFLLSNGSYSLTIEGNCDERGTNEYNLALGERRADAAKKFLSSLGVAESRIATISYGEEKPVDSGRDETAWAKNRRDEFRLSK
jgi:peptidoglycan-associated lipoprotein